MKRLIQACLSAALLIGSAPAIAAPVIVTVQDKGVKTLCAEEDNVYAVMTGPGLRHFTVTARQPIYGPKLTENAYKADFTNCGISGAKDIKFKPREPVVLYEDSHVKLMGITYGGYWREQQVAVEVAGRKDGGFHLIQLFVKHGADVQEALARQGLEIETSASPEAFTAELKAESAAWAQVIQSAGIKAD